MRTTIDLVRRSGGLFLLIGLCSTATRSAFAGDAPKPASAGTPAAPGGTPAAATDAKSPSTPPTGAAADADKTKPEKRPQHNPLGVPRRFSAKLTGRDSRQIRYLAEQVESQTTLSAEDKAMVRKRLENYASRMDAGMIEGKDVYDGPEESLADVEAAMGPLPSAITDAATNRRPRGVKSKPPASPMGTHSYILKDIAASLNADARKQFNDVGLRWQRLKYRGGPDGPLSRLIRALRDPLLELSEEKAQSLRNSVGAVMASVKSSRKDPEVMSAVAKEAREKVDAELTPEQIKRLDATLAEIAREHDAEMETAKRLEQRWKDEASTPPPPRKPRGAKADSKPQSRSTETAPPVKSTPPAKPTPSDAAPAKPAPPETAPPGKP